MNVLGYPAVCRDCVKKPSCVFKHYGDDPDFHNLCSYEGKSELDERVEVIREENRANYCGNTIVHLESELGENFYKPVDCKKFWCPHCGGRGGVVNQARFMAVWSKIDVAADFLRQFVFTVPVELRPFFWSRDKINALNKSCNRIIENVFGKNVWQYNYIHLFGDDDTGKFNPHINIHLKCKRSDERYLLSDEVLEDIKGRYIKALTALCGLSIEVPVVDVFYSFRVGYKKMRHAVMYMSRPVEVDLNKIDYRMKKWLLLDMKGFRYVRGTKMAKDDGLENVDSGEVEDQVKGLVSPVTGAPLRVVGILSRERFEMLCGSRCVLRHPRGLLSIGDDEPF